MIVRNTLFKRTIIGYCIFFFTVVLIWWYHEKSIKLEEDEDTLKPIILSFPPNTTSHRSTIIEKTETKTEQITRIDPNRLDYWLTNNSRTVGINLTAILAPKRPGKYLVYVCHENCGGKHLKTSLTRNSSLVFLLHPLKVGVTVYVV
jgi:hypothetical protein